MQPSLFPAPGLLSSCPGQEEELPRAPGVVAPGCKTASPGLAENSTLSVLNHRIVYHEKNIVNNESLFSSICTIHLVIR